MRKTPPFQKIDRRSTAKLIELALAEEERERDIPNEPLSTLQRRGTRKVLEEAITLCRSDDPKRRDLGATILGQLGHNRTFPEECCDVLLDLVRNDPDSQVMVTAVFALGHLGNDRCEPDLVALRHHPNEVVRHGVAFSLHGTTRRESLEALLEMMDDPVPVVRDWATTTVGMIVDFDSESIRGALLHHAEDEDEMTRGEALRGLARRQDARGIRPLIAQLKIESHVEDYFVDAAKIYLGLDEAEEIDAEALAERLHALQALSADRPAR